MCPIKKTPCVSPHCYIREGFSSFTFKVITCKDADKETIYFVGKDGDVTKLRGKVEDK